MTIHDNQYKSEGADWDGVTFEKNTTWEGVKVESYIKATTMGIVNILKDARKNGYQSEYWKDSDEHWDLGIGAKKSLEMATEGWRGKAEFIQRLADKCADLTLDMPTQQIVRDQYGPMWDMAAVINGDPYCALNFREAPSPELIKLVINGFYSYSVDAPGLEKRAAAIAALVLTLHTAGYAVECSVIMPAYIPKNWNDKTGPNTLSEVIIHTPGDVFDLERIAFWMGHPAAVRNVLYAIEGVVGNGSHGSSLLDERLTKAIKNRAAHDGAIYIDSMYSGQGGDQKSIEACKTEAGALKWIREQVERVKTWSLGNLADLPHEEQVV